MDIRTLTTKLGRFLIERVLLWAGFGLLLYFIHTQIGRLPVDEIRLKPALLFASTAFLTLSYLLNGVRMTLTLRQTADLDMRKGLTMFFSYQLSTYVPGGIWQFLHIGYQGEKAGFQKMRASLGALQYEGVTVGGAILMFAVLPLSQHISVFIAVLLIIGVVMLIGALPLSQITKACTVITGKDLFSDLPTGLSLSGLLFLSMTSWVLAGTGFFLLIDALLPELSVSLPTAISVYAGSWAAGFLVFIVPGGLGVREGTLTYLLGTFTGISSALLIAVAARIWATIPQLVFGVWALIEEAESGLLDSR